MNDKLTKYLAKEQIRELVYRYCRAVDRRDYALLRQLYHKDATDDHGGMFNGNAMDFIEQLPQIMAPMIATVHYVTNLLIAVKGNYAEGEIYTIAWHRMQTADGLCEMTAGGRYLDVYECRDGEQWKFAKRKIVMDWNQINPVEEGADQQLLEGITQGQASAADPSYSMLHLLARHSD